MRCLKYIAALVFALIAMRVFPSWRCGKDAEAWLDGEVSRQRRLAETLAAFEEEDDKVRADARRTRNRFKGEWALVTHQMTALGLAQICLAHPELTQRYRPVIAKAAAKSWLPEMRAFGTRAWGGEDALASLSGRHGHAYLAYSALAVGVARQLDSRFPKKIERQHDALIAAYERRLLASKTGLIETYPNEAYPTDTAAVAAAVAVHGRATGKDRRKVLAHWAKNVRRVQIDPESGLVYQRMRAANGRPLDAPRGSGTGLAAYFAGFASREIAALLTDALIAHETSFFGFGAVKEYASGYNGAGDVDSGPVVLGVSVAATGFSLAPFRAFGRRDAFVRLYRTTELFGLKSERNGRIRFSTGGPVGNALLLAMLTSGPEVAP